MLRSQVLISEKRMSNPANKLQDWDAQKLGSDPRQRKKFLQSYEIPFSALSTTTKPGCFVSGVRWEQGLLCTEGGRISCSFLSMFGAGSSKVRNMTMAQSQPELTLGPCWRDRARMEPS